MFSISWVNNEEWDCMVSNFHFIKNCQAVLQSDESFFPFIKWAVSQDSQLQVTKMSCGKGTQE